MRIPIATSMYLYVHPHFTTHHSTPLPFSHAMPFNTLLGDHRCVQGSYTPPVRSNAEVGMFGLRITLLITLGFLQI